jgi:hypothetical protein
MSTKIPGRLRRAPNELSSVIPGCTSSHLKGDYDKDALKKFSRTVVEVRPNGRAGGLHTVIFHEKFRPICQDVVACPDQDVANRQLENHKECESIN